ncbi:MAG: S-methyl-5'-thioadenosine phosphorylase [Deltaproteobacteria bacterium]|nr:S-methyl-5'-thioadenosine phosphorylase [Deltaproteobacteria bacterium]
MARIGIIGGSGLYQMDGIQNLNEIEVETPFGRPSDALMAGVLNGRELVFLARHGRGHRYLPTEVPYRANIWAMKAAGVDRIFAISAVGSMKEEIHPGHMVVPRQFIDLTRHRKSTFFGDGCVAHVSYGHPVDEGMARHLVVAARELGLTVHDGGTYVCMEGPQFSSRAESMLYRSWGVDVIGMTNATEAKLAREAELGYATLALSTDYDCWKDEEVTADAVVAVLLQNARNAQSVIRKVLERMKPDEPCAAHGALKTAIVTGRDAIPPETRRRLEPLIGKYLG